MKKLIILIALLQIKILALATDFVYDGIYYSVMSGEDRTCAVGRNDNLKGEIIIPEKVIYNNNEYKVTYVSEYAFAGSYSSTFGLSSKITAISLPCTIDSIGNGAFIGCQLLTKVELNDSKLLRIGEEAFMACYKLTAIKLPKTLTRIEKNCFFLDRELSSINLEEGITEIDIEAFKGCTNLKEVVLPSTLKSIRDGAFADCNGFSHVSLPNSLNFISANCFSGCTGLVSVTIPNSITTINDRAFYNCTRLKSINIPSSITTIVGSVFDGCSSLSTVVFEDGQEELSLVGHGARGGLFFDCPLDSLYLGRDLSYLTATNLSIGPKVFSPFAQNSFLRAVYISDTVTKLPHCLFYDCSGLKHVYGMKNIKELETADFRHYTTNVGVFQNCISLETIIIPDNTQYIGDNAFSGCKSLQNVYIGNGVEGLGGRGPYEPGMSSWESYGGADIFYDCTIKNLYLGKNLKKIGKRAFSFDEINIQNIFCFSESLEEMNSKTELKQSTFYVIDPNNFSTILSGYTIKKMVELESDSYQYIGKNPLLAITNKVTNTSISYSKEELSKDVGNYSCNLDFHFTYGPCSSTVSIPIAYTITKASLTIIPYDVTISYGEDIPDFKCLFQGLKNNESPDYALSKSPIVTTSATKGNGVGTYKLYVSGAEAQNYSLSYGTGTLTIKPAQQTINWNQTFENIVSDSKIELNATSSCGLNVQYSSSDPSIAYVVVEGNKTYLYCCKDGNVVITASQLGNSNYAAATSVTKTIVVTPRMATGINLNCSSVDLKVGEEYTLIPTIMPSTTIDKSVEWKSLDNTIATVYGGVVHALKLGETTIQATTKDGSNLTATCKIIVSPTPVSSVTLSKTEIRLILGSSETISTTVLPNTATNKEIEWEVQNANIVSVNNGLISALAIGSTTVTARAKDGSGVYATCSVVVDPIIVNSIELSPVTSNVDVGGNVALTATVYPANASNKQLLWQSSNEEIATVNNGVVTGVRPGNVIITAATTDGSNKTATASITVNKIKATNIYIDKSSMKMYVGDEEKLIATISPVDVTDKKIVWSTSDASVATVVEGIVNAKESGSVTITATTTDGTNLSAVCQVTVEKRTQTVSWSQNLENIQYGGQLIELAATASSGLKVKYKSNDEDIVNIFDLGDIVYLNPGNCGKTTVIAYQEGDNEYMPTELTQNVEVVNANSKLGKSLIAYYSQSTLIDGIVAELANQIAGYGVSVYSQKIEPTNSRINEANVNSEIRDSIMMIIERYPNETKSYPSINSINVDVSEYDNVIMVYPLWNASMAAPMQTFNFTNKEVLKKKSTAYIEYDLFGDVGTSSNAKALRLNAFNIDNKEELIKEWLNMADATGIISIKQDQNRFQNGIFDLQGRKLQKAPQKGMYIENGSKIIK